MRIRDLPFNLIDKTLFNRSIQSRKQSIPPHVHYFVTGTSIILTLDLKVHGGSEHTWATPSLVGMGTVAKANSDRAQLQF